MAPKSKPEVSSVEPQPMTIAGVDLARISDLPALTVRGPEKGRWRIGRRFGSEAVTIPVADLTLEQIQALLADPELTVMGVLPDQVRAED